MAVGPAALSLVEELVLVHQLGLGGVGDEPDLHVLVDLPQELHHPEEERAGKVLLRGPHGAGDVHHGEDDCVGLVVHVNLDRPVAEVVGKEADAGGAVAGHLPRADQRFRLKDVPVCLGERLPADLLGCPRFMHQRLDEAGGAPDRLLDRPLLVEVGHDPGLFDAVILPPFGDLSFGLVLALQVGKPEVLQHHPDQLFDLDLGLEIIHPRRVAGLSGRSVRGGLAADGVAFFPLPLADAETPRAAPAVDELVALEAADGHLYDLPLFSGDDGLFADDVGYVSADRVADFLPMAGRVLHPALGKLPILLLNGHAGFLSSSRRSSRRAAPFSPPAHGPSPAAPGRPAPSP